ncbi:ABC transporter substrate-binding protein, partial [Streptomyces fungicidicus]
MFNRNRCLRRVAAIASISSLVAGCGLLSSDSSDDAGPIVVGTTSSPSTLDPAASWDSSWELFRNIFQTLLSYPVGATAPQPDAAKSCEFTDSSNQVFRCELRDDLTFSDGSTLDAKAVKHSIDRIRQINVNGGPAGLLGSLERVQAPSEREVVFYLNKPDATFPFVLATPAMSIVAPDAYPAGALREESGVVGSGPYTLRSYEEGKRAELTRNDRYKGFAERRNNAVTIRYFQDSGTMVKALRDDQVDLTYRGVAADDIIDLQGKASKEEEIQLIDGTGTDINYLVFNPKDPWAGKKEVRQAVAQVVDRAAIAHKVYKDTVEPLYSMVPKGLTGHTTGFFDDYG